MVSEIISYQCNACDKVFRKRERAEDHINGAGKWLESELFREKPVEITT